jgi:hypothetical protein
MNVPRSPDRSSADLSGHLCPPVDVHVFEADHPSPWNNPIRRNPS